VSCGLQELTSASFKLDICWKTNNGEVAGVSDSVLSSSSSSSEFTGNCSLQF